MRTRRNENSPGLGRWRFFCFAKVSGRRTPSPMACLASRTTTAAEKNSTNLLASPVRRRPGSSLSPPPSIRPSRFRRAGPMATSCLHMVSPSSVRSAVRCARAETIAGKHVVWHSRHLMYWSESLNDARYVCLQHDVIIMCLDDGCRLTIYNTRTDQNIVF